MTESQVLPQLLENSAQQNPDHPAVKEAGGAAISYADLNALADLVCHHLQATGVRPGDRVGIYMSKSIDALAAIFGILKAGAAYVPVDASAPSARDAYILHDCNVQAILIERRFEAAFLEEMSQLGTVPPLIVLDGVGGGQPLREALQREPEADRINPETVSIDSDDIAYLLYTSGSTGTPKGVTLSHRNAMSFVDWSSDVLRPKGSDRFSSHAPFHFDLSIFDLYVSIKHGATLILIDEETGKSPRTLAGIIADEQISIWYSTPSILSLLLEYGKIELHDMSALRLVLFAGEVFPVKHLRALKGKLPKPVYYNWYGPTETNVCTYFEIPDVIPDDRTEPYPIGQTCEHVDTKVVDASGVDVERGQPGELCVTGAGVMLRYWNLPEVTDAVFLRDGDNRTWYRTGDIVAQGSDGDYQFLGRRDRMVKRRGYRVELGEVESGLYKHPQIKEAAAIALDDEDSGLRIKAFFSCHDSARPSLIELKRFCAANLPAYMIPDLFSCLEVLPKTSTDKLDYQRLHVMA